MCPFVLAVSAKCACQCGMEIAESMLTSDSVSEVMWASDGMCHSFFFASNVGGRWHGALNVHALTCVMLHMLVSCSKDAANFFFGVSYGRGWARALMFMPCNVHVLRLVIQCESIMLWMFCFINFGPRLLLGRNLSHMLKNALICFGVAMCNAVDSFILFC